MRIAIAGAGISGLATAFYLNRAQPGWELVVYDAEPRPGGTMQTVNLDGFLFEAGGNGFLTNKPDSLQLAEESGAQPLLLPSSDAARRRFIFDGALHPLPESPPAFIRSPLLTVGEKLRVLGELFVPPRRDGIDETLQEFGYRRVGRGLTDVFLDAMAAGIYGTTPDKVSVKAAFPLVVELERQHGGLFRGMLARRKKSAGPGGILMSFRGGLGRFAEHLQRTVPADWRLGEAVIGVARDGAGWRVETTSSSDSFDRLVLAAPPHCAAQMLRRCDPELATLLERIEYTPIAVVGFGYRSAPHALDGFGLLTTTRARQSILGVLWDSSIFPDRAPDGCKALRVLIGGQRDPALAHQDEAGLVATARAGLESTMGLTAAPDATFVRRWDRGIPSYTVGHESRVDAIFERAARVPGLHFVCNAYHGIAMNDCVRNGRELARRIATEA